ncbi:MAG: ABC transporter permease subunit [Prevotellaceae bacterium]|nr:ABC transporter permease subunit [Prevotellaceae bacterium]
MNTTLFMREVRSSYKLWLIFIAILAMYISVIISMFDPKLGETLDLFAKAMPEMMSLFGMGETGATLIEFLSNYLYGMLMIVFPMVFIIMLANRLVAAHVDHGSMTYLLASPNTRRKVALTQVTVLLSMTFTLLLICVGIAIGVSQAMFPGALIIGDFLLLNLGLACLLFALCGYCFFISCISNETGRAVMFGAGIPTFFYLVQMLANMGGKLADLKYATIFTLFNPKAIIAGDVSAWWMCGVLVVIGAIFFSIGIARFEKRDLPL